MGAGVTLRLPGSLQVRCEGVVVAVRPGNQRFGRVRVRRATAR
jgi:hypothetical protein